MPGVLAVAMIPALVAASGDDPGTGGGDDPGTGGGDDPGTGGGESGGVPEPTSGILLMIGGAALALRRR